MKKTVVTLLLASAMINCGSVAFAETVDSPDTAELTQVNEQMDIEAPVIPEEPEEPTVMQDYYVFIDSSDWYDVKYGNNVVSFYPQITNYSDSPDALWVKYVNSSGETIGNPLLIPKGETATYANIPFNSGKYTVYVKAYQRTGSYHFKID